MNNKIYEGLVRLQKAKELLPERTLTSNELNFLLNRELTLPIAILNEKLTVLESVVKYLYEEQELTLAQISKFLNRDQRNIWHIYNQSIKKYPKQVKITETELWVPISIFSTTKLSANEVIIVYLKQQRLSYREISQLMKRNERTIWTSYQRALNKDESLKQRDEQLRQAREILLPVFKKYKLTVEELLQLQAAVL